MARRTIDKVGIEIERHDDIYEARERLREREREGEVTVTVSLIKWFISLTKYSNLCIQLVTGRRGRCLEKRDYTR